MIGVPVGNGPLGQSVTRRQPVINRQGTVAKSPLNSAIAQRLAAKPLLSIPKALEHYAAVEAERLFYHCFIVDRCAGDDLCSLERLNVS